ncbi:hypothetical protein D3C77_584080 [compost metagenome]
MIAQVAVADDVQRTSDHQCFTRLLEHAPGEEVADHLLLMERRVAQHHVQGLGWLTGQAIVSAHNDLTISQCRLPVFQC